ncbi:hypothetical protein HYV86_03265 [Candidatus Woesearchaeota archaeon]|nr:hypothetical protein [Candidatus Woesearchaeota archaeon]
MKQYALPIMVAGTLAMPAQAAEPTPRSDRFELAQYARDNGNKEPVALLQGTALQGYHVVLPNFADMGNVGLRYVPAVGAEGEKAGFRPFDYFILSVNDKGILTTCQDRGIDGFANPMPGDMIGTASYMIHAAPEVKNFSFDTREGERAVMLCGDLVRVVAEELRKNQEPKNIVGEQTPDQVTRL